MNFVNVEAIWEESLPSDPEGWRLEFTIPINRSGRFQPLCETFGRSVHGKNRDGLWIVDALKIRPTDGKCYDDIHCWVEAVGFDGKSKHYFRFPEPVKTGHRFVYAVDDDYIFKITKVTELCGDKSEASVVGEIQ